MSMIETIDTDLKNAMKERNEIKLNAIRGLKTALKNKMIEKKAQTLTEEEAAEVIQKQVKQRKDSIEEFKKGNRLDLAEKEGKEMEILLKYLPAQLSAEELESMVRETIHSVGAKTKADSGKVMKELMPKVKGKTDGKEVNRIVSALLP